MKKIVLILVFVLLTSFGIIAQPNNNVETSAITEKEFNRPLAK